VTQLQLIFDRYQKRLEALEGTFTGWVKVAPSLLREEDFMFLDGLVSSLWQHWCIFCRRIVFASANGCTTRSGGVILACVTPNTWERVSYIASRAKNSASVQPALTNRDYKKEPTWGDVNKLQDVITALAPMNIATLISCFGSISRGPIHVQTIRNAISHRNHQTLRTVKDLRIYYNVKPIRHPVESVMWVDPTSGGFAFMSWVDEMRIIADIVTK